MGSPHLCRFVFSDLLYSILLLRQVSSWPLKSTSAVLHQPPPPACCSSQQCSAWGRNSWWKDEQLTFQFIEKYHLVVRMRSWSFTVMQNRSQVKRVVCSWSALCESSTLHFSEKARTTFKVSPNTIPVTLTSVL